MSKNNMPPFPSAPMFSPGGHPASTNDSQTGPPSPSEHLNHPTTPTQSNNSSSSDKRIGAAAVAGGVAGLALAGPVVGIISAVGAGALATQNNKAGDVARASADVVLAAGERAKKMDQKHHVVDKTKKAAGDLFQKAKAFENKHHLGEKTGKSLTKGLNFVAKKIKPKDNNNVSK